MRKETKGKKRKKYEELAEKLLTENQFINSILEATLLFTRGELSLIPSLHFIPLKSEFEFLVQGPINHVRFIPLQQKP
jgi:hypothetical protein